jgi:hypothetical protein
MAEGMGNFIEPKYRHLFGIATIETKVNLNRQRIAVAAV